MNSASVCPECLASKFGGKSVDVNQSQSVSQLISHAKRHVLLVCMRCHGSHVGQYKEKPISPQGSNLYFCANSAKSCINLLL